jgi:adenylylsulfate kinase-like enzyme
LKLVNKETTRKLRDEIVKEFKSFFYLYEEPEDEDITIDIPDSSPQEYVQRMILHMKRGEYIRDPPQMSG